MGSHSRPNEGETNVWLTPEWLIKALGPFDLDPCAASDPRPFDCAAKNYTVGDNGLMRPWDGLVWMNPPYGPHPETWLSRLSRHGNGIGLLFARTETRWGQFGLKTADAVFFLDKRLTFLRPNGIPGDTNAGAPSMLLAYGSFATDRIRAAKLNGLLFFRELAA